MAIKVSIIIPTYNQSDFIRSAVLSALMQDYQYIEIIVADDNSTDNTEIVLKEFFLNEKVKYFKNECNIGRVKNYRKALFEYATGDWVINVDGDDYLTDNTYISFCIAQIERDPEIVLISGNRIILDTNKNIRYKKPFNKKCATIDGHDFLKGWLTKYRIAHLTSFYNRRLACNADFYNLSIISVDWASLLKLCFYGKVFLTNRYVGTWRKHSSNASLEKDIHALINNFTYLEEVLKLEKLHKITKFNTDKWRKRCIKKNISDIIGMLLGENCLIGYFNFFTEISNNYQFAKICFFSPKNIYRLFRAKLQIK
jgi:glycosyltransferase involved in cell wall biosynthesis